MQDGEDELEDQGEQDEEDEEGNMVLDLDELSED